MICSVYKLRITTAYFHKRLRQNLTKKRTTYFILVMHCPTILLIKYFARILIPNYICGYCAMQYCRI